MKPRFKQIIAILLALVLMQCALPLGVSAAANSPTYHGIANNGHRGINIDIYSGYYTDYWQNDGYGGAAYGPLGCAWFATARAAERTGTRFAYIYSGQSWFNGAAQRYHLAKGSTPRADSLACYENHVAYVENVIGNTIVVSEGGATQHPYNDHCIIHDLTPAQMQGNSLTGRLLGYVYLNANPTPPAEPQVTFQNNEVRNLTETDARLYTKAVANMYGHFSVSGIKLWDASGAQIGQKDEEVNPNYSNAAHLVMYYDINKELGVTLQPGSDYTYQMYTVFNNRTFTSDVMSFKTPGTPPTPPTPPEPPTPPTPPTPPDGPCDGGASCPSAHFTDEPPAGHWAHEGVDFVVSRGLMGGFPDKSFRPSGSVTRAQFVTVLYRLTGSDPVSGRVSFRDVSADAWYHDPVIWAAENNVVFGYPDGTFHPNAPVTREQIAAMLFRFSGSKPGNPTVLNKFPDGYKVQGWAKESMSWAVQCQFINGVADGNLVYLQPQHYATRAQFAKIMMSFLEKIIVL